MKIGIFGGSFDPIHLGHTRIINEAIISLQLDKMLIVPTKHNPWKEDSVANNQQRIEMIQIALKDNSKCEVLENLLLKMELMVKKHILQECCMILPKKWIKNKKMI